MIQRLFYVLLFVVFFLTARPAGAQTPNSAANGSAEPAAAEHPRVGLALSGGAARGLAHIGVLKVLEEEGLPVDVVSGTSMGALVGGLYAMGYSAAQIEAFVLELDLSAVFTGETKRQALRLEQRRLPSETVVSLPVEGSRIQLPSGLRTGQEAIVALSRLTWPAHAVDDLTALPRPFAAVAVDLRAGEAVALKEGYLADAMYASMSLPTALVPVRREDRLFVDGGLVRNLPAEDAIALGADLVLGVDVTGLVVDDELASVGAEGNASALDMLVQTMALGNRASIREQRERLAVLVEPDLDGLGRLEFDRAAEFIARGEAAARAQISSIRALAARASRSQPPPAPLPAPTPVLVGSVRVVGVPEGGAADVLVRSRLDLGLPRLLLPDDAEAAVSRVYGTGLFDRASYRVLPSRDGRAGVLVVRVVPPAVPDRLGVGLRYDEFYGPALLVSLALKNRLRFGDTAALTARLGRQSEIRGSYFTRLGTGSPLTVGAEVGYASAPYDEYDSSRPGPDVDPTRYRQRVFTASAFGGLALTNAVLVGLRIRAERQSTETVSVPSEEEEIFEFADPYAARVEAATDVPYEETVRPFIVGFDGVSYGSNVLSTGLFAEVDTRDRIAFPRRGLRVRAEAVIGRSDVDNTAYREAYQEAFLRAYERFEVPDVLLDDAADRQAERTRIASEVRAEVEQEIAASADVRFPGRAFAPFQRFVADVEAALPAGPLTVFGRAAYAQAGGDGLPAGAFTAVGGIHASAVYAESFFPLVGLRPQQRVGTRGYLGVMGLQTEIGRVVLRGFINIGDAYGKEDRLTDEDEDGEAEEDDDEEEDDDLESGFALKRAALGVGIEIGTRTLLGPASVILGTTALDRAPHVGVNLGFSF